MFGRWAKLGVHVFPLIFIVVLAACTSSTGSVSASKAVPESETEARPRLVRPTMWPQPEGELPPAVAPEGLVLIEVPSFIAMPPAFYEVQPLAPDIPGPIWAVDIPEPKSARPETREIEEPVQSTPHRPEAGAALKADEPAPLAPPAMTTTFGSTNFDDNGTNTGFLFVPADPIGAANAAAFHPDCLLWQNLCSDRVPCRGTYCRSGGDPSGTQGSGQYGCLLAAHYPAGDSFWL